MNTKSVTSETLVEELVNHFGYNIIDRNGCDYVLANSENPNLGAHTIKLECDHSTGEVTASIGQFPNEPNAEEKLKNINDFFESVATLNAY